MADDGTKIYEPTGPTSTVVTTVDTHEIDYGSGDLRDRQRFLLAGQGPNTDAAVRSDEPNADDFALVVRNISATSGDDTDNQFSTPQGAGEVFTGVWKNIERHGNLLVLYAIQPIAEAPASVVVEYSDDAATVKATSVLVRRDVASGPFTYAVYLLISNGGYQGRYARLKVTNGATPQTQNPIVYFARNQFPFTGSYGALDGALSFFSQALLTRAVQAGLTPDNDFTNVNVQGRHSLSSTSTPLNGDTGGTDHIFRGPWVEWAAKYGGMALTAFADVAGTLYVDFSDEAAPVPTTDASVQLSQAIPVTANALFRRAFTMQSRWVRVRYVNGPAAQARFGLDVTFLQGAVNPASPIGEAPPNGVPMAVVTKALTIMRKSEDATSYAHTTATAVGSKRAADVNVTNLEEGLVLKALPSLITEQGDVNGAAVIPLPTTPLTTRATVRFTNPHATLDCYYSESATKVANRQGDVLMARSSIDLDLMEGSTLYWTLAAIGGAASTYTRNGSATSGVTAVTNPDNVLLSDDARAILTSALSALSVTGFSTPSTGTALADVRLQVEARKDPAAAATLTATHIDTVSAVGANVTSIASPAVTADPTPSTRYLVAVARRNAASVVSGVTGMGATWAQIEDVTSSGATQRLSLWYNTTPVTTTGPVTASFSAAATNCSIAVSRITGVDPTTPFDNHENLPSPASGTTYADSIVGTALGLAYQAVAESQRSMTFGDGFTEQADTVTGGGGSAADLAVGTLALAASGAQAYSGTLSGSSAYAVIAATLKPAPAVSPQVRVRYQIGGTIGATMLTQTLTSSGDAVYEASIFADRSWVFADIAAMTLLVDQPVWNGTNAQIDRVGIKTVETTGADVVRVCVAQLGGATP
jgi:hypothetical protein